eukprot:TRINITY_DN25687_c0_g1_i1.p1 TRINITY_DN25687_c0_g1~~TRINITY_DN25687_c0_g1_i1.p1  ORF type:complete len:319 (-),score=46.31 TRINITY_DN25687_c0_g1_i1:159-1115(-)
MTDPGDFTHRFVSFSDSTLHYVMEGDGVPVVLVHGWPDLWFGWRKQIKPLVREGYRVIVPDMRGFGQSTISTSVDRYALKSLCSDLCQLLDHLDIPRAIFVGHDHGGSVVWRMCLHFPSRVIAVASVCTPYTPPRDQFVPVETIAQIWPSFKYQVYFNSDDAITEFQNNTERFFRYMLRGTRDGLGTKFILQTVHGPILPPKDIGIPKLLTPMEYDYYLSNYKKSGFAGNLNYYRTHHVNFLDERGLSPIIDHEALMITAGKDSVLTPEMTSKMGNWIPHLTRGHVPEGNHWLLQEFPEKINPILILWLKKVSNKSHL